MLLSFTRDIDTENGVRIIEFTADRLRKKKGKKRKHQRKIFSSFEHLHSAHSDSIFGPIFRKERNYQTSEVRRTLKHGAFDTKVLGDGLCCLTVTISLCPLSFITDLCVPHLSSCFQLSSFTIKVTENFASNFCKHKTKLLLAFHTLS